MQDPGGAGVILCRRASVADDDQGPVQVIVDGQEQEVLVEDVHSLSYAQQQLRFNKPVPE